MRMLAAIIPILLASCILNAFKGPDYEARHVVARLISDGIDTSIDREVAKQSPNGYLTKPYSRRIWNDYWNRRIDALHDLDDSSFDGNYRGPSGQEFIGYFIRERRARGLPEIPIESRNRGKIRNATTRQ